MQYKLFLSVDPKQSSGNVTKYLTFSWKFSTLGLHCLMQSHLSLPSSWIPSPPAYLQVDSSFVKALMNIKVVSTSTFSDQGSRQVLEMPWKLLPFI